MLPAYLGYFLGLESAGSTADGQDATASLMRALVVGLTVSAGFLLLFAVAGAVVSWTSLSVGEFSPWLTVIIGAALLVFGIRFLSGWEPKLAVPRLDKGGRDTGLWSMFLFGLSYAIASLSCTIGPFTSVVAATFSRSSVASGLATFLAYAAGMALLLMVLTVTLAMAQRGLALSLRRALPYIQRVSGVIMALMGAYLTWYGVYEIRLIHQGRSTGQGPVGTVTGWSADLSDRIARLDPLTVALALLLVLVGIFLVVSLLGARKPPAPGEDQGSATGPSD
jgi:cytochrome c biogenesis protein CcdA